MRNWKFWDWAAYGALAVAAFMMAFDAALRNSPEIAKFLPGLVSSAFWAFAPGLLVIIATMILLVRGRQQQPEPKMEETKSLLPPRQFPKVRYLPDAHFALLPIYFTVDVLSQLPIVDVRFYVISYLPRPLLLTEVDLSLQLSGTPSLEDIPLRQKDWRIDPNDYEVISCRRQLTNAERDAVPWKAGRLPSSSFTLSAKATDGEQNFSYGPVSAMVIEGWINANPQSRNNETSANITLNPESTSLEKIILDPGEPLVSILAVIAKNHSQEIPATPKLIATELGLDENVVLAHMRKYHNEQYMTFRTEGAVPKVDTPFFLSAKAWKSIAIVKA